MNRTVKIVLGILAGLLVLSLGGVAAGFFWIRSAGLTLASPLQTDPERAARIAGSIAEYTLPDGFGAPIAAQFAGFSLAGFTSAAGASQLYLAQIPDYVSVDQAEAERQLREATAQNDPDRVERLAVVYRRTVSIRGESVILVISEGTSSAGTVYRVANGMFRGKGGQALVNISMPAAGWDAPLVDAFLSSLR